MITFLSSSRRACRQAGMRGSSEKQLMDSCLRRNDKEESFTTRVFAIVKKIPRGKTLTYQQVARLAGRPKAYRAVGNILNTNFDPKIPCHRVIRADGQAGGYNRGRAQKIRRLRQEGAHVL